jgi:hypothetical protein
MAFAAAETIWWATIPIGVEALTAMPPVSKAPDSVEMTVTSETEFTSAHLKSLNLALFLVRG